MASCDARNNNNTVIIIDDINMNSLLIIDFKKGQRKIVA